MMTQIIEIMRENVNEKELDKFARLGNRGELLTTRIRGDIL